LYNVCIYAFSHFPFSAPIPLFSLEPKKKQRDGSGKKGNSTLSFFNLKFNLDNINQKNLKSNLISITCSDGSREREKAQEGYVLEGRKVSWSSSTRQSQDVRDVVEVVC
jgi:hypothetical protein